MEVYHFLKYHKDFTFERFVTQNNSNIIYCFDLEDSIQDVFDTVNTKTLKASHRDFIKSILHSNSTIAENLKIGIRINAVNTDEQELDIATLAELKGIHTILLPKTSGIDEINDLISLLERNKVQYQEIIPIIESKTGMTNLESIAAQKSLKVKHIAFGHCDYNLDVAIYPFFHQTSREYWNWIEKIQAVIQSYDLKFINSAFLELNNDSAFNAMLSSLHSIYRNECGQCTLTLKQLELCKAFDNTAIPLFSKLQHRLNLKTEYAVAENYVTQFENYNNKKGFSINSDNKTFLSPHEYIAAKKYLAKKEYPEFKFCFVGGCFPVQGNILFEDLFHQVLKNKIENNTDINFIINIIRYERLSNCIQKVDTFTKNQTIDAVVFSIRPEPMLRLSKLSYKFINNKGEKKRTFNLPFLKLLSPEKYDLLSIEQRYFPPVRIEKSNKINIGLNLNLLFGYLIGNHRYAMKIYLQLVTDLIVFCKSKNFPVIIISPALRTSSISEKYLSKRFDKFIHKNKSIFNGNYIIGSDLKKDGKNLFFNNGIHANEYYHELIANRVFDKLNHLPHS
ncbi:MAG: aldolase/citrate lyase family protein [Bacteroidetes bacterium]|nr:aldolase/citrate lyase family protein [Bacteroidota bacterium]